MTTRLYVGGEDMKRSQVFWIEEGVSVCPICGRVLLRVYAAGATRMRR